MIIQKKLKKAGKKKELKNNSNTQSNKKKETEIAEIEGKGQLPITRN